MKCFTLISLAFIILISFSCRKHNDIEKPKTPFEFTNLSASTTTPAVSEVITVNATAKGDSLVYTWSEHE